MVSSLTVTLIVDTIGYDSMSVRGSVDTGSYRFDTVVETVVSKCGVRSLA